MTKREAEIKLDETDFYEKKLINKRKKLILEGKDPDEIEEILAQKKKQRKREKKKRAEKLTEAEDKIGEKITINVEKCEDR